MAVKSNLNKFYAVNRDEAENGKWLTVAPGVELKVRRITSTFVAKIRRKLVAAFPNGVPASMEDEINLKTIALGVIADWRGIEIEGLDCETYDADTMLDLLEDMPDLAETVATFATNDAKYRVDIDETEKN